MTVFFEASNMPSRRNRNRKSLQWLSGSEHDESVQPSKGPSLSETFAQRFTLASTVCASCFNTVVWGGLMKRMSSLLTESAVLASLWLTLTIAFGSLAVAQGKMRIGTWELNLEKSTFSPGPAPRRQTLTFEQKGAQWMALIQGTDASGNPINVDANNLMITFDGRDHSTPTTDYETTAWKAVDDYKYLVTRKKAGKVVMTSTNVLSTDGKTMTITTIGQNAVGQPIHNVRVYDKK